MLALFSHMTINLGSNVLNWTSLYLSLPLSLVLLYEFRKIKFSSKFMKIIKFSNFRIAIIIIILLFGVFNNYQGIYRDSKDRFLLKNGFNTKNIVLVLSTKERTEAIDDVITEVKGGTSKEDEVLYLNSIPLLYYLTETKCLTRNPWTLHLESEEYFKQEINSIMKSSPPEIVVIAKGSTRWDPDWPKNIDEIEIMEKDKGKLNYLYTILRKNGYSIYWENAGFEIHKKV